MKVEVAFPNVSERYQARFMEIRHFFVPAFLMFDIVFIPFLDELNEVLLPLHIRVLLQLHLHVLVIQFVVNVDQSFLAIPQLDLCFHSKGERNPINVYLFYLLEEHGPDELLLKYYSNLQLEKI